MRRITNLLLLTCLLATTFTELGCARRRARVQNRQQQREINQLKNQVEELSARQPGA